MSAQEIGRNPYIVGNPIRGREMFFGREDDFRYLQAQFADKTVNRLVVFSGDRRSGKTSILLQILDGRLGDGYLPVLIDMQMLANLRSDREFYLALVDAAGKAAEIDVAIADEDETVTIFERLFMALEKSLPDKTVLFLFDEYELVEAKINNGQLTAEVVQALAAILDGEQHVCFVFAGSTGVNERSDCWWPLLVKATNRRITYLSEADTVRVVTEPLKGVVAYPDSVVKRIYRLTAGQPFFAQVVCQNLVDLLIEEKRTDPKDQDLDNGVEYIINNPLPHMIYTWKSQSDETKLVLSALASATKNSEQRLSAKQLKSYVKSHLRSPNLDEGMLRAMLESAFTRRFLAKDAELYRFRMDLLRRWIAREHSIWNLQPDVNEVDGQKLEVSKREPFSIWLIKHKVSISVATLLLVIATGVTTVTLLETGPPTLVVLPFTTGEGIVASDPLLDGLMRSIALAMHELDDFTVLPYNPLAVLPVGRPRYYISGIHAGTTSWYDIKITLFNSRNKEITSRLYRGRQNGVVASTVEIIQQFLQAFDEKGAGRSVVVSDILARLELRSVEAFLRALHYIDVRTVDESYETIVKKYRLSSEAAGVLYTSDRHYFGHVYEYTIDDEKTKKVYDFTYVQDNPDNTGGTRVMDEDFVSTFNGLLRIAVSEDRRFWFVSNNFIPYHGDRTHPEIRGHIGNFANVVIDVEIGFNTMDWAPKGMCIAVEKSGGGIAIFGNKNTDSYTPDIKWRTVSKEGRSPDWSVFDTLAFHRMDSDEDRNYVWLMDGDQPEPIRIVQGMYPRNAPDGYRFTYLDDERKRLSIFDTRDQESIVVYQPDENEIGSVEWSSDGTRIVAEIYADGDYGNVERYKPDTALGFDIDIVMIDVGTGELTNISDNPGPDLYPVWSPDGTRIAFQSHRDGNWEIYLAEADGSGLRNISNHQSADVYPEW